MIYVYVILFYPAAYRLSWVYYYFLMRALSYYFTDGCSLFLLLGDVGTCAVSSWYTPHGRTHAQKHNRAVYFCCLQVWLLGDIGTCVVHKWHGRNYSLDPLRPSILRRWFLTTMLYVTMILHNIVTMRRSARIEVFSLDTDVHTYRVTYIHTIGSFVELSSSAKNRSKYRKNEKTVFRIDCSDHVGLKL